MTIKAHQYSGHYRTGAGKDATYTLRRAGEAWQVMTWHRVGGDMQVIEAHGDHSRLATMVNSAKRAVGMRDGGSFVINEYGHVLIPAGNGSAYIGGKYTRSVDFVHAGRAVSGRPTPGLRPGMEWTGPRAGLKHTLTAGGRDIRRETVTSVGERKELLSESIGKARASALANYLARSAGSAGGTIYLNEHGAFFGPSKGAAGSYIYLGSLQDGPFTWFPAPVVYV